LEFAVSATARTAGRSHLRLRLSTRRLALFEAAAANGFTFASLDHLL
jgi:hypothetical protein